MERFAALQWNHLTGLGTISAYRHGGNQAILGERTMAKPNVHTASRDELVEAGVRAELADEILKRRRKGAIRLEALEEVPGSAPPPSSSCARRSTSASSSRRGPATVRPSERAAAGAGGRTRPRPGGQRQRRAPPPRGGPPARTAEAATARPTGRAAGGQGGPGHDGSRGRGYRRSGAQRPAGGSPLHGRGGRGDAPVDLIGSGCARVSCSRAAR